MKKRFYLVTTTFQDLKEAKKIIRVLLEKKLIASATILPSTSLFLAGEKVIHNQEFKIEMKTKKSLYKKIEKELLSVKSSEILQLCAYEIVEGTKEYLKWMEDEIQ